MRNQDRWSPSKYVSIHGKLRSSRNEDEVMLGSRLVVDLVASFYERYLKNLIRGDTLDLGCGKCPLYQQISEFADSLQCVDWGESEHGNLYTDQAVDLNAELPFSDASFDTIICSDVIEHLQSPELFFREAYRLLRDGGYLILNTPFAYPLHEVPHDYQRLTACALRWHSERAGFFVETLDVLGGYVDIFVDMLAKLLQRKRFGRLGASFLQALAYLRYRGMYPGRPEKYSFPLQYGLVVRKV